MNHSEMEISVLKGKSDSQHIVQIIRPPLPPWSTYTTALVIEHGVFHQRDTTNTKHNEIQKLYLTNVGHAYSIIITMEFFRSIFVTGSKICMMCSIYYIEADIRSIFFNAVHRLTGTRTPVCSGYIFHQSINRTVYTCMAAGKTSHCPLLL
jgi:hypothetical protein